MRLIDANELVIDILAHDISDHKRIDRIILDAPIVEAIPIEWIKEYASEKSANDMMDCYWTFWEEDILQMIDDWEKENENNH